MLKCLQDFMSRYAISIGNMVIYADVSIYITDIFLSAFLTVQSNKAIDLSGIHFTIFIALVSIFLSNLLALWISKLIIDKKEQISQISRYCRLRIVIFVLNGVFAIFISGFHFILREISSTVQQFIWIYLLCEISLLIYALLTIFAMK